ncbi:MAG: HgcAB-associated protein HgcC [Pirellulaceae bacterium]
MARRKEEACCDLPESRAGTYQIESIITIDERGQMVLPKQTRDRAGIRAGDRFALVTWTKNERVCCLSLIKTDELTEMVTGFLGSLTGPEKAGDV